MSQASHAYGNWTIPRSTGFGGSTMAATLIGVVLLVVSLVTGLFAGWKFGGALLALSALVMVPLLKSWGGRSGYEVALLKWQRRRREKRGELVFRSGPFSRVPGGRYRLPGVLGTTSMSEWRTGAGHVYGMIHYPRQSQYTIVFRAFPQGGEAIDQDRLNNMVFHWGSVLASFGQDGDVMGAEAVVETLPATGLPLTHEVRTITATDSPQLSQLFMVESAEMLGTQKVAMEARLAVTFKATTKERQKNPHEQAIELSRRIPAMMPVLAMAGISVRPMNAAEIVEVVKRAYDPASQVDLERGRRSEDGHGVSWNEAGPAFTDARNPTLLRHDGARSAVWEMQLPPKGAVTERVLRNLLAPNGAVARKRINVVYRPHSAEEAAQLVESDYKNAHAGVSDGRALTRASAKLRLAAADQAREEEARGHGLTRFGMLMTVTEPEDGDLPRAEGLLKSLSTQSRLKIRRAYGYQDIAFAAGLGCGVLLPDHSSVPGAFAG